jgi:hypothetical protein
MKSIPGEMTLAEEMEKKITERQCLSQVQNFFTALEDEANPQHILRKVAGFSLKKLQSTIPNAGWGYKASFQQLMIKVCFWKEVFPWERLWDSTLEQVKIH